MNAVIVCQKCKKPLKIPGEALGKSVRCPACQSVFVAQRDEFKPRAAEGESAQRPKPSTPTAAPVKKMAPGSPAPVPSEAVSSARSAAAQAPKDAIADGAADEVLDEADAP